MTPVLFVTPEAHPLMKTGGLGDVCGSLPLALKALGCDVRLLLPAYRDAKARAGALREVARMTCPGVTDSVILLEGRLPGSDIPLWLLDAPALFDRPGNPYMDPTGAPWPDNALRYATLCRAAVEIAQGRTALGWRPDVIHGHDWQTGLIPALLAQEKSRPATLFTIHNLAYQGLFPQSEVETLALPESLWSPDALEFYGQLSFIKGGLVFADRITTVSPNYAREIQTLAHGCGLEGLLQHRQKILHGILNGIDEREWDPARDPALRKNYDASTFAAKIENKRALRKEFGLAESDGPLIGIIGRLVHQKGFDVVLDALPQIMNLPVQLVVLGSGEAQYAQALQLWARRVPQRIGVHVGYNEQLAHRIEAGADMFLMPSRFEPCGLNQLYSLRYGTVPIVRAVGGLADTVIDANDETIRSQRATGVVFGKDEPAEIAHAVARAVALYQQPKAWRDIALRGMRQDFTWSRSARQYLDLYRDAIRSPS